MFSLTLSTTATLLPSALLIIVGQLCTTSVSATPILYHSSSRLPPIVEPVEVARREAEAFEAMRMGPDGVLMEEKRDAKAFEAMRMGPDGVLMEEKRDAKAFEAMRMGPDGVLMEEKRDANAKAEAEPFVRIGPDGFIIPE